MPHISIIGMGRFGQTLVRLFNGDFDVTVYDKRRAALKALAPSKRLHIAKNLKELYANDIVIYAVPISAFEGVIKAHLPHIEQRHLLIDTLSVKVHPETVLRRLLKTSGARALLTHPMFGPDSSKEGFAGLPIVVCKNSATGAEHKFWSGYFAEKKLRVIQLAARTHDMLAARSQGLTHFIGRLLDAYGAAPSPIDTLGMKKLLAVREQTCNDSWQLFADLQHYNPYTKAMRQRIGNAYDALYNDLLPAQAHAGYRVYGIQGGKGSFNEEALRYYLRRANIPAYRIAYLHTTERVLRALHAGDIDQGQFAIHNSRGGIVDESIEAMARYRFNIADQFAIPIAHALMIRPDATLRDITEIMAHPQVFAQCREALKQKYPQLKLVSGKGVLIDHAKVAEQLGKKLLPKHTATMGSKALASLYGLTVIEDNLQDLKDNYTSFLAVTRG